MIHDISSIYIRQVFFLVVYTRMKYWTCYIYTILQCWHLIGAQVVCGNILWHVTLDTKWFDDVLASILTLDKMFSRTSWKHLIRQWDKMANMPFHEMLQRTSCETFNPTCDGTMERSMWLFTRCFWEHLGHL